MILYLLFVLTFLAFPLAGFSFKKVPGNDKVFPFIKAVFLSLLATNLLYICGYSFKGDYPDYILFSIEYGCGCFLLFNIDPIRTIWEKILNVAGYTILVSGSLIGIIGTFLFFPFQQELACDKKYHFSQNEKHYEVRRYTSSFGPFENVPHTFEIYRSSSFLPIENKAGTLTIWALQTTLDLDYRLHFSIKDSANKQYLTVNDTRGHQFVELLK